MRQALLPLLLLSVTISAAQNPTPVQSSETSTSAPTARTQFHIRYVNGSNVYIDGGRSAGLAEGTELVLKQDFTKPSNDKAHPRSDSVAVHFTDSRRGIGIGAVRGVVPGA